MEIVEQLQSHAKQHGLSSKQLAREVGVPYDTLKKWFTKGTTRKRPSEASILRITAFLDKPSSGGPSDLFSAAGPVSPPQGEVTMTNFSNLIRPHKTVRDPVRGDIFLNRLEVDIIDTTTFQRLHRIRQLGTAFLVYPGAVHTRFNHSLGTVAMAQRMIDRINRNPQRRGMVGDEETRVIRLCALLHDITHVPFGHSLEDEGHILPKHNSRLEQVLSKLAAEIAKPSGTEFQQLFPTILKTLKAKDQGLVEELDWPFASDLVGNTICADLLDYVSRDIYFTGLREAYDDRFLDYLLVQDEGEHKGRVVINIFKKEGVRRPVVSEVLHLLRLRYSLGEKVYFHHAKMIATAMVIGAVQAAQTAAAQAVNSDVGPRFDEAQLMGMGDDELLQQLSGSRSDIAVGLVDSLRKRALYEPVYMLPYSPDALEDEAHRKKKRIAESFKSRPAERFQLERKLENWNKLKPGSVVIYCPDTNMNLKEIETLVLLRNGEVKKLKEAPGGQLAREANSISEAHEALWKMYVLLHPRYAQDYSKRRDVKEWCAQEFGLPNALDEVDGAAELRLEAYIERWALENPALRVTVTEKRDLIESARISSPSSTDPPPYEQLQKRLNDLRA